MRARTTSIRGIRTFAIAAIHTIAFGLFAREAHATWACETAVYAAKAGAAVTCGTLAMPVYRALVSGVWQADTAYDWDWSTETCTSTPPPSPIDPYTSYEIGGPSAGVTGVTALTLSSDETWTAYTDGDGDLYVGESSTCAGTSATEIFDAAYQSGSVTVLGTPSIAYFDSTAYVFASEDYFGDNLVVYWTCSTSSCSSSSLAIDGGGYYTHSATTPAAVVFNGDLWAFYWDQSNSCLKGQYSSDGSTWNISVPSGASDDCIDGHGGSNGQTSTNSVGEFTSAFVDTNANRLYVFYQDSTAGALRVSYMDASVGTWYAQVVDSSVTMDSPAAPVLYGTTPEVYYIDSVNHHVRESWKSGTGWASHVVIDGTSSSNCSANGYTTDGLGGPISATLDTGCSGGSNPSLHVYYTNISEGGVREALWY